MILNQSRVWTMIYADSKWRYRTPPQGPKAGFTSQPYDTRREALAALRERFNAVPTYYRFEVERGGRRVSRLIERRVPHRVEDVEEDDEEAVAA